MKKKITAIIVGCFFAITSPSLCLAASVDTAETISQGTTSAVASAAEGSGVADGGLSAASAGIAALTSTTAGLIGASFIGLVAVAAGASVDSNGYTTTVQH